MVIILNYGYGKNSIEHCTTLSNYLYSDILLQCKQRHMSNISLVQPPGATDCFENLYGYTYEY